MFQESGGTRAMPSTPPSQPRTFELASGSHWEAAPAIVADPDAGRVAQIALPVQHQHHHLVAEVSLPVPSIQGASGEGDGATAVQGYLRIEGSCGLTFAEFRRTSSSTNASHSSGSGRPSRLTAGMLGLRGFGATSLNDPTPSSTSTPHLDTVDATPVPRRRSTTTPTAPQMGGRGPADSPISAIKGSFNDEVVASPMQGPSWVQEPDVEDEHDTDVDELLDDVPTPLDFSYLNRRSNSGSPPFISPFASRSNSVASRSRGSWGSTDTNRSQGTRPNSRNNSSNATSFSTSSSFSLSSAGLTFSDNPLNRIAGVATADLETRFLISYPGAQFVGFGTSPSQGPFLTRPGDGEECVSELSFPSPLRTAAPSQVPDGPLGFLTLVDLTILANLIERSLKTDPDDSADAHTDNSSDSGASEVSGSTDSMDMPIPVAQAASTCCCEYYRRLFDLIPLVSGLRPTDRDGDSEELSPLMASLTLDDPEHDSQSHHELYAHHGRYLRTPFGVQEEGSPGRDGSESGRSTRSAVQEHLKAKFERRRSRFEDELVQIVREDNYFEGIGNLESSTIGGYPITSVAPSSALEEARLANERFQRAAGQTPQTTPRA
ncbi:hypothetical protein FA13DRAFT_476336 [Coprinellus micaceus]|uniref:Uncharacterized protein n=1 Tax=Coprinellus micaceus TaxID=71717 RepID=A0A4Y7TA03_COPMI|nr:hypothetical protein FA13DRAFT_476336 [Coprinellus micaceus]